MPIKYYFPISVAFFVMIVALARYFVVPVAPFAFVLLVGETLLGFQLEDHKASKLVGALLKPLKSSRGQVGEASSH
jgi:hypothetical protein